MAASRFCRYQLRTTDVTAARGFYTQVLGPQLWGAAVSVAPLPERAAAQGAPPHWLGHIGTPAVAETAARIVALGGQQLGPLQPGTNGAAFALLRDPFGAVVALGAETEVSQPSAIAWHQLITQDHERAFAWYAGLFGWTATEAVNLGPETGMVTGRQQRFAWDESRSSVGGVADTARLAHVHAQWLFHFGVADLDAAMATVRACGGQGLGPLQLPGGDRAAPCEDPQGGAFGLYQFAR